MTTQQSLISVLAKLESGKRPKGGVKGINSGVPSIGGEHLNSQGGFTFSNVKYVPTDFASNMKKGVIQKGDILIVKDGATTAKTSYVGNDFPYDHAVVNEHVFLCRANQSVNSKYLFYYLWSEKGRRNILEDFRGAAQGGISTNFAKIVKLPIPAPQEQEKIVTKIEELFSEIDNSTENLDALPALIETLYQSRMKKIFLGKDTHEKSNVSDELYQNLVDYRKSAPNAKRLNLEQIKETDLPDLGKRGFWATVDLLATNEKHAIKAGPFGSSLKKSMYSSTGYKLYGQEQVIRQDHEYGDYFIPQKKYEELIANKVASGDTLISLVGTIGKVLVLPEDAEPGIINPRLVKISFNPDHYLPKLFKYYFESQFVKNIYKLKTHGATMDVLNLGIIRTIPIPVFPITKQQEMLASIEELQTEIVSLRSDLLNYRDSSKAIKQSILSKAFKGEFV